MKIVDRKVLMAMPLGTIFSEVTPGFSSKRVGYDPLCRLESVFEDEEGMKFLFHILAPDAGTRISGTPVDLSYADTVQAVVENKTSVDLDFTLSLETDRGVTNTSRYAVWEEKDIRGLIGVLKASLPKEEVNGAPLYIETFEDVLLQAANKPGLYSGVTYPSEVLAVALPSLVRRANRGTLRGEPGCIVGRRSANVNPEIGFEETIVVPEETVSHRAFNLRMTAEGIVGDVSFRNNAHGRHCLELYRAGKLFFGARATVSYGNRKDEKSQKVVASANIITFDAHVIHDPSVVEQLTEVLKNEKIPKFIDDIHEYDTIEEFPPAGNEGSLYVIRASFTTPAEVYVWSGGKYIHVVANTNQNPEGEQDAD